jgi:dihydroorotase
MQISSPANAFIRNVDIYDAKGQLTQTKQDLIVENGKLVAIGSDLECPADVLQLRTEGAIAFPGLVDMYAFSGEPGNENNDTLKALSESALAGGFTALAISPEVNPATDSAEIVNFIRQGGPCEIYPYGAVSKGIKGQHLAELIELANAGAIGFSDGDLPISNTDLMLKALQYAQHTGLIVLNRPEDQWLAQFGQMHEGHISTLLGMRGIPPLAETLMIRRDLELLKHVGGRLHFNKISTAEGVALIEEAKNAGLNVTASVALANLIYTDEDLLEFDTNLKAVPPLRSTTDQHALFKGLKDGIIDVIVTDHKGLDIENKRLEFDLAAPGQIQLQTALSALYTAYPEQEPTFWIPFLCHNPRKILGLPIPKIEVGAVANFVVFDPKGETTFTKDVNRSVSSNSALLNKTLKGMVNATVNNNFMLIS